ncbi:hypothetical protein GPX89_21315 [Nocardia sp. ET3-3]|uniref:Septum formation-related domain-containing protein n=1 Tax=Nocardia terrae TaxID=2675851 RepID=A0A7K1UZG4_9NOCA|nr:septum formation family protein [Nocardia terrae]MVU79770.1 hypothetical protein [Nocardia terrae]
MDRLLSPVRAVESKLDKNGPLSASTVRWGLLAMAVGVTLAVLITMFVSNGFDSNRVKAHAPGATPPTGAVAGSAFGTAAAGDCLTWSKAGATDLKKLDCGSKHMFEVTGVVDLSKYPGREFGPGAAYPDSLRFTELRDEHCVSASQAYLGGKLDPRGKFDVGLIQPGKDGWKAGERTLRCGLQVKTTNGEAAITSTGSVRDVNQSKVYDTGTCIGIKNGLPTGEPVDCTQPHTYEMMSTVDLGTHFNGGPPSKDEQDKFMSDQCAKDAGDYLGSPSAVLDKTLTVFFDYVDARSWLVGSRSLNCMVGKGNDQGFSSITGSAKGDIQIDGQVPVPPPNNGRYTPPPLPGASPPVIPQPR